MKNVAFNFGCKLFMFHATNSTIGVMSMGTKDIWAEIIDL
jgi:hypothetical protein